MLYIICFERLEILDFKRLRWKYASEILIYLIEQYMF